MKHEIKSYIAMIVAENRDWIIQEDLTIAEYLLQAGESYEFMVAYLSDEQREEIELADNRLELEAKAAKEVVDCINANYNYKLKKE